MSRYKKLQLFSVVSSQAEHVCLRAKLGAKSEEVGNAFINVRTHVPVTALNYIPHCIAAPRS